MNTNTRPHVSAEIFFIYFFLDVFFSENDWVDLRSSELNAELRRRTEIDVDAILIHS